jgi:hypothetical protein
VSEKLKIWKPLPTIGGRYWFENTYIKQEKFHFVYAKNGQLTTKIHVVCQYGVSSYRYTNEMFKNAYLIYLGTDEELQEIKPWCFYTVEDSSYLTLLEQESATLSKYLNLKHYCIITEDEVVEIISGGEPSIELYESGKLVSSSAKEL